MSKHIRVELIRPKLLQLMNFLGSNKKESQPIHVRRGKIPPMSHKPRPRHELKIRPEASPKHQLPKLNSLSSSELTQYMSCGGIKLTIRSNISLHTRKSKKPSSPSHNPQASTAPSRPFLPLRPFPSSSPFLSVGVPPPQSQYLLLHSRSKQNPQELRYIPRLPKIEGQELLLTRHRKKQKFGFYLPLRMYVNLEPCQKDTQYPSSHSHILLPLGNIQIDQRSQCVIDRFNCSSLGSMLDQFGQIPSRLARKYLKQLAGALHHLHEEGFTHNRINPETILHDQQGKVLLDYMASSDGPLSEKQRIKHFYYFPPETLLSRNYYQSEANDVWALGCLALQMQMEGPLLCSPLHPYNKNTEGLMTDSTNTLKKVQNLMISLGISPVPLEKQQLTVLCMQFASLCLTVNIEKRSSLSQLLTHPYISA